MKVQNHEILAAMKENIRDLDDDVKTSLLGVAEDVALPVAKRIAPHVSGTLARSLIARATKRNAYLTTSLTRRQGGRRLGLHEFGGTVKKQIRPTGGRRALLLPDGRFVARVTTPRTYRGQHFMERSVTTQRAEITRRIEKDLSAAMQRHIDRHSVYPI